MGVHLEGHGVTSDEFPGVQFEALLQPDNVVGRQDDIDIFATSIKAGDIFMLALWPISLLRKYSRHVV